MKIVFHLLRIMFLPALKGAVSYIKTNANGIPFRYLVQDVLSVLQKVGFFVLFAVLASVIFIVLPQGIDTLLVVIEEVFKGYPEKFIALLAALFVWSILSEFGIRYAIYVSDNSGKSMSDKRVAWKKAVQRIIAGSCLLWPTVLIAISLAISYSRHKDHHSIGWSYVLAFFCLYVLFCILTNMYFYKTEKDNPGFLENRFILAPERLPAREGRWLSKLYGIYNDFVYSVSSPTNFNPPGSGSLTAFNNTFNTSAQTRDDFPQSDSLSADTRVPAGFKLINFSPQKPDEKQDLKWTYRIPTHYYHALHKQVKYIAVFSLLIFLVICFIPADTGFFETVGAPGLVCVAFACWIGIYVGLIYLDYAKLRRFPISIRFLLLLVLLYSSIKNDDHPVRQQQREAVLTTQRPELKAHFKQWFIQYKKEMDAALEPDTQRKFKGYPVIFICAEGGALRTGGFTAFYLTKLQRLCEDTLKINFKRAVYAMSGVSGGSLGLGVFNAVTYVNNSSVLINGTKSVNAAQTFFEGDFISSIIGKMFFGDLLNLFLPWHVNVFDRAIAMEKAWEKQYSKLLKADTLSQRSNVFSLPFNQSNSAMNKPLIVFNTDEVESGKQCWIANFQPAGLYDQEERDLLASKIQGNINYSTGINFSTRFPLFSPGAMLRKACLKYHYLDGGYVENTGAGTMLEILQVLNTDTIFKQVRPVVIFLRFSDQVTPPDGSNNINFGNEITEIIGGIYNARKGRSDAAVHQLDTLIIKKMNGGIVDAALKPTERDVPMNWILSKQSLDYINKDIDIKLTDLPYLRYRLRTDSSRYMPYNKPEAISALKK